MPEYANKSGKSGIKSYELADDNQSIDVEFKGGGKYRYSTADNGAYMTSQLSAMAENGEYLNRLINSANPKFEKLGEDGHTGGERGGDSRKLKPHEQSKMSRIHARYQFGNKEVKTNLKAAVKRAMMMKARKVGK